MLQDMPCPLCAGTAIALPVPHPGRSVVSDGRVIARPLQKMSCLQCGAACHASNLADDDVRAIYAGDYALAAAAPESDAARARIYAGWIREQSPPPPRRVLEVGCGSGALLRELSHIWPDAECVGIDPAPPRQERSDRKIRIERGFIEDMPDDSVGFDLIVAINVIEHLRDPSGFLASLQRRLASRGRIIIVCPAAMPPNSELVFYDHLYSLTPEALIRAAATTSLQSVKGTPAPASIGAFQMMLFESGSQNSGRSQLYGDFQGLHSDRQSYLERWRTLDELLLARSSDAARLVVFGGGQTAAMLRAYAPSCWARTEMILLDNTSEAWALDKPVHCYENAVNSLANSQVLIATAPRVQAVIAERLKDDGLPAIRWDDVIPA